MARYRRVRRFKKRSGRWSANIQEVGNVIVAAPSIWSAVESILQNPLQSNTVVSQAYTVKNIEISFTLDFEGNPAPAPTQIEGVTAYIMFVPQGMTITNDYNTQHPEYIMAYKFIGSPTIEYQGAPGTAGSVVGQQYQPYRVKTRLSRKLQTGDSVVLFVKGVNQSTNDINLRLSGLIRWWTKAN